MPLLAWFQENSIKSHYYVGYVDDLHGLIELPETRFCAVMNFMSNLHASICLEGVASHHSVDFPDLTIFKD